MPVLIDARKSSGTRRVRSGVGCGVATVVDSVRPDQILFSKDRTKNHPALSIVHELRQLNERVSGVVIGRRFLLFRRMGLSKAAMTNEVQLYRDGDQVTISVGGQQHV